MNYNRKHAATVGATWPAVYNWQRLFSIFPWTLRLKNYQHQFWRLCSEPFFFRYLVKYCAPIRLKFLVISHSMQDFGMPHTKLQPCLGGWKRHRLAAGATCCMHALHLQIYSSVDWQAKVCSGRQLQPIYWWCSRVYDFDHWECLRSLFVVNLQDFKTTFKDSAAETVIPVVWYNHNWKKGQEKAVWSFIYPQDFLPPSTFDVWFSEAAVYVL